MIKTLSRDVFSEFLDMVVHLVTTNRPVAGGLAARQGRHTVAPLGSRVAIQKRAVSTAFGRQRHRLFHDSGRQRLGQFGDGRHLLVAEDRARGPKPQPPTRRSPRRCPRLHRARLQHTQATFETRQSQPNGVRGPRYISLTCSPRRRQQLRDCCQIISRPGILATSFRYRCDI